MSASDPLLAPIHAAEHRDVGGIQLDVVQAGSCRVKRMVYPRGFRWSTHMKAVAGTDLSGGAYAACGWRIRIDHHFQ
ncbi:MAG: hypothetical protein M3Z85_03675 [Acidobacteriota bacterium]|nr:hypothetical protein [Acidobacteriota bacterium]